MRNGRSTVGKATLRNLHGGRERSRYRRTRREKYSRSSAHRDPQSSRKTHALRTRTCRAGKVSKYRPRSNAPSSNWHELCWKSVTAKVEFLSKKGRNAG